MSSDCKISLPPGRSFLIQRLCILGKLHSIVDEVIRNLYQHHPVTLRREKNIKEQTCFTATAAEHAIWFVLLQTSMQNRWEINCTALELSDLCGKDSNETRLPFGKKMVQEIRGLHKFDAENYTAEESLGGEVHRP